MIDHKVNYVYRFNMLWRFLLNHIFMYRSFIEKHSM